MLFGILLAITWLILLIRYPHKALPVSLIVLCGFALLASYALWQQQAQEQSLQQISITLHYAPEQCPPAKPLQVSIHNQNNKSVHELRWKLYVQQPGQSANLIQGRSQNLHYDAPQPLAAHASWQTCLPLPTLTPGYRPASLDFHAVDLRGHFRD